MAQKILMASSFHLGGHHLRQLVISHFLLVWLLLLVGAISYGLLAGGPRRRVYSGLSQDDTSARRLKPLGRPSLIDGLVAVGFSLFVALYVVLIYFREDFAYYDNYQITDFLLQGGKFPPPIWTMVGRFFPLGFQEFNVLVLITKSVAGFHSFAVVQLAILIVALFVVLNEFKFVYRVLIVAAVMLVPSFVISFTGLIYPERNLLFWVTVLVVCLYCYSKTKRRTYLVACLVATHFALYYKETVVVLVVAYAASSLLVKSYAGRQAGRSWRELARENSLFLGMLALSGAYVTYFLAALSPLHLSYATGLRKPLSTVFLTYVQTDWLPLILLVVFAVRLRHLISSGEAPDPLWEPLAVGALSYSIAIIALRLVSGYYMAPANLIAILYMARIALGWLSKPSAAKMAVVATVFSCLVLHDVGYSAFRIVERKGVIAARHRLADFLEDYAAAGKAGDVQLFFPYSVDKHLMELSAYLRYRGLRVAREGVIEGAAGHGVVIAGPQAFPHSRCVDYKDYVCAHMDRPPDGALIVVLPEDNASVADVENAGRGAALLFSFKACAFCASEGSWLRLLHAISPGFSNSPLPEHWMQLHVFRKISPVPNSSFEHASIADTSGQGSLSP